MKKPGDMGANPTMQIDLADLDEARLEALVTTAEASEPPPASRAVPPPLPPSALAQQAPAVALAPAAAPTRRSPVVLVIALVACLAVSFGVVALLRLRSTKPAPIPAAKPASSVITIPTVDMNDEPQPAH